MKKKYKKGGSNNTFYSQALMLKKHIDSTANKIHKVSEIWQNIKKYGISIPATINSKFERELSSRFNIVTVNAISIPDIPR